MIKLDLCNNYNCINKYQCKRYCTPASEGSEKIDLSSRCNKDNEYVLYVNWNSKKKKKND